MKNVVRIKSSRRRFLRDVPAVAAGLTLASSSHSTLFAAVQTPEASSSPTPFKLFPAGSVEREVEVRSAKPGATTLFEGKYLHFVTEAETLATNEPPDFQMHEEHDHVIQIFLGSTVYEVGGKLVGGHTIRPREWRAPAAEGATKLTLKPGDILIVPRNTPHRRHTDVSVTFSMITFQPPEH